ncbi:hypothetical protein [Epibacterium ulvae]|nr:hypothetical protein [Epibacterium ulvae]
MLRTYAPTIVDLAYLVVFVVLGAVLMWLTGFGPIWVGALIAAFFYPWQGFIRRWKMASRKGVD